MADAGSAQQTITRPHNSQDPLLSTYTLAPSYIWGSHIEQGKGRAPQVWHLLELAET